MIAKDRRRRVGQVVVALAAAGALGGTSASAQQATKGRSTVPARSAATKPAAPVGDDGKAEFKVRPADPNEPVAIVNGESITRSQLAAECVAREGEKILETMIARKLIEQAVRANKVEVSAAEVDAEIEKVAMQMAGVSKEDWLHTLAKERNVSPTQYRRDIIFPALALRKLASGRVEVTKEDMDRAYEAKYGDKLVCRMILCNTQREAQEIWNRLQKNPGGFEKEAQTYSKDEATRAMGGMFGRPLSRHETPLNFSDAAFRQLVDGDPGDKDPTHKPKDGDISGLIQLASVTGGTDSNFVILKREKVLPAQPMNRNDPNVVKDLRELMFEAKVRDVMAQIYESLMAKAAIENRLTGRVTDMQKDEVQPAPKEETRTFTQNPQLNMRANPIPDAPADNKVGRATAGTGGAGVSEEDRRAMEAFKKGQSPTAKK